MFTAAQSTNPNLDPPSKMKCPSMNEWIKKMWYLYIYTYAYIYMMKYYSALKKKEILGFPGGAVVENLPANAGDTGSSPGLGRSHMPRSN